MQTIINIYHLTRADFLERTRRFSFLVMVMMTLFLGYLAVPPTDATYQTFTLGNARGVYNSPWVGTMFGVVTATILPLIAFYLIHNAVRLDRQTGVGRIIAGTPTSKPVYMVGKWLSNVAVLTTLLIILTATAVGMQLFRAEETHIDLASIVTPIWMMGFPVLAMTASMSILIESIPFLQGSAGHILYFLLYMAALPILIGQTDHVAGTYDPLGDFYGMARPLAGIQQEILKYDPAYNGSLSIGAEKFTAPPVIFRWEGISWTFTMFMERLTWIALALGMVLMSAIPFDRFDPARSALRRKERRRSTSDSGKKASIPLGETVHAVDETKPETDDDLSSVSLADLTPPALCKGHWPFITVLSAELRLALKGHPWWWYAGMIGFIAAGTAARIDVAMKVVLFSWLWPLPIWSMMGTRETRYCTGQLVFCSGHPLRRQLPAMWLSGALAALLPAGGLAFRLVLTGQAGSVLTIMAGAATIPSLALALGAWSGTPRLFEVVYLIIWYVIFNMVLDFELTEPVSGLTGGHITPICLALSAALCVASVIGRWRQVQQ